MNQSYEFYVARAREAANAASEATLVNVRETNLRAEKTWRGLADHALRVIRQRAKTERERAEFLDAERQASKAN